MVKTYSEFVGLYYLICLTSKSMEQANEVGPCKHTMSGQHPDFAFSSDSEFDSTEYVKKAPRGPKDCPKMIVRRKQTKKK